MEFKRPGDVLEDCVLPFCAQTTDLAPLFVAEAYDNVEKKIKENKRSSSGKLSWKMGDLIFLCK